MKKHTGKITLGIVILAILLCGLRLAAPPVQASPQLPLRVAAPLLPLAATDLVEVGWPHVPFTTTAANPVTGWYHIGKGHMYDKTNKALATSPSWTDCVTAITVDATTGVYEDAPDAAMDSGWYLWRLWDSAAPAVTDTEQIAKLVYWNKELKQITWIGDL